MAMTGKGHEVHGILGSSVNPSADYGTIAFGRHRPSVTSINLPTVNSFSFGRAVPRRASIINSDGAVRTFDDSDKTLIGQLQACAHPWGLKLLLLAVPIAILFQYVLPPNESVLFLSSFLGLIPLAGLLGDFTEDVCMRTNPVIGALINVTFGNATELIISIFALKAGYLELIKMSLLGSILGNMLLVLGTAFFVGGLRTKIMVFNPDAANTYIPLLMLSVFSFVIPSGYVSTLGSKDGSIDNTQITGAVALLVSREVALIACVVYVGYMYFQLFTHSDVFDAAPEEEAPEELGKIGGSNKEEKKREDENNSITNNTIEEDEEEEEEPQFTWPFALIGIAIVSILISVLSDILVDSINPAAKALHLSHQFIGIILVPIVGNAAEHATAIIMAYKGKVDIAVGVALGSSIQIALFMMPFLVLVGWAVGAPLDMNFHPFSVAILFVSVLVAAHTTCDGRTNWLEGLMLFSAYIMTAVLFFNGNVGMK